MKEAKELLSYNHHCFGCGEQNPQGLKLKFQQDGDRIYALFTPGEAHQGYPGIIHGGITSTLLDEVMSNCMLVQGVAAMTVRLEVRFKKKIPLHQQLRAEGWITAQHKRLYDTAGRILLEDGTVAAKAAARFMTL
ncbi:MAG: PaaI family thioesterase [Clostridia bacterium]|jgi:acyl-coenzyme A thioesterase PaaI-like protein|nr:PaaI family thioesterase [Clostridia bacterium]